MPKQTHFTHPPTPPHPTPFCYLPVLQASTTFILWTHTSSAIRHNHDSKSKQQEQRSFLIFFLPPSLISNFSLCYICHCSHQGHGIITPVNELLSKKMHYVLKLRIYCRLCLHKYALKARCFLKIYIYIVVYKLV